MPFRSTQGCPFPCSCRPEAQNGVGGDRPQADPSALLGHNPAQAARLQGQGPSSPHGLQSPTQGPTTCGRKCGFRPLTEGSYQPLAPASLSPGCPGEPARDPTPLRPRLGHTPSGFPAAKYLGAKLLLLLPVFCFRKPLPQAHDAGLANQRAPLACPQ